MKFWYRYVGNVSYEPDLSPAHFNFSFCCIFLFQCLFFSTYSLWLSRAVTAMTSTWALTKSDSWHRRKDWHDGGTKHNHQLQLFLWGGRGRPGPLCSLCHHVHRQALPGSPGVLRDNSVWIYRREGKYHHLHSGQRIGKFCVQVCPPSAALQEHGAVGL